MAEITRSPTSDINVVGAWSGTAGSRYQNVDDYPDTGDTDRLNLQNAGGGSISFGFAAPSVPGGSVINSVKVRYHDYKAGAGAVSMGGRVRVGGVGYNHVTLHDAVNGVVTAREDVWTTNPATAAAWTLDDVNGTGANPLQGFGIGATDADPAIRFTGIQLAVDYSTASVLSFTIEPVDTEEDVAIADIEVTSDNGSFAGNVTLAFGENPGSATLSGTLTQAAVAGVATFPGISINNPGTGYTLIATASGHDPVESAAFNITQEAATKLSFSVQPTSTRVNGVITPALQVSALDSEDDLDTNFVEDIVLNLQVNPGSATLSGTLTQTAVGGIATFPGLSIDVAETGYVIRASSGVLTVADSDAFDIVVRAARSFGMGGASRRMGIMRA